METVRVTLPSTTNFEVPLVRTEADADETTGPGRARRGVDMTRLREALRQLAAALVALHSNNRTHRDIKPENIMVEPSGRLVLMDFGLVIESSRSNNDEAQLLPAGTFAYMSPEQAAGKEPAPSSDWYSFGVVLFEALTGMLPFDGTDTSILIRKQQESAPDPARYAPDIPDDLRSLCVDLLERDPAQRPTGSQVMARLGREPEGASGGEESLLRSHPFVGREQEKSLLSRYFQRFLGGEQVTVVVHGHSGLGKSELIRSFLKEDLLFRENVVLLTGRCVEREAVSFKAVDQVIDSLSQLLLKLPREELYFVLPANLSCLTTVFPVLARVVPPNLVTGHEDLGENLQEIRATAFAALRELFSRLAQRYDVVIFIDDLQWADDDSYKLLRSVLIPSLAPRIFLLFAMRTSTDESRARASLETCCSLFPCKMQLLPVEPLSSDEALELARRLTSEEMGSSEGRG